MKNDTVQAKQIAPYGIDSAPVKQVVAIYSGTDSVKDCVVLGYIVPNQLASPGENRLFSSDADGNLKAYIWLKNDGTILIGGNADNAVRYAPLDAGLQQLVGQLQSELSSIASGIAGAGGVYVPGTLSLDISGAKINEVKTP